ncbi:histidine ammonia-lyase [Leucothrix mucor]|uniref:histidine ammonia-lyase n=1 Tax=Leucothrix mucor TaxID=45248 RepID=UPI0003B6875D|nr:histidine ammonia-lyase [Leucothrix mucor]
MTAFTLKPGEQTLAELRDMYFNGVSLSIDDATWAQIEKAQALVRSKVDGGDIVYGVNTGFGLLASKHIEEELLSTLQHNLILSHATGVGKYLPNDVVRLILLLKINGLSRGVSGIRREVLELLVAMLNKGVFPAIPEKGSVGASGDLAPLAHLSLPVIGEGKVYYEGELMDSATAFEKAGLQPLKLAAKEGLALLNGTQVSTALAMKGLFEAEQNINSAFVAGSLTVEAALGSRVPFDPRIQAVRGQHGQIEAARVYRELLQSSEDSEIANSHAKCDKVQDPYSLRCQPQVMGACLDQLKNAARIIEIEANAVSDNPLIFTEEGDILSGGNFHAEPIAFAADNIALAIAEIGALSERRMALLLDANMSALPPFLVKDAGVNSGFMIAQVTAAALASENKSLAHPASVDSLPTSANQEDHVSMATFAARRLTDMNLNTRYVVAIELLAACQGIELRRPLKSNDVLEGYWSDVRSVAAYWDHDRYFQPDLEAISELIQANTFGDWANDYIADTI